MDQIEKVHWHPAYVGAMGIELKDNRADLVLDDGRDLAKEPLEIDLLIIEKKKNLVIKNEIGAIFRQYNVTEYKSPGDDMNISNYVKTVGYACILKGTEPHVDDIPLSELTVTLMREDYPKALFAAIAREGGRCEQKFKGIYYIYGLFMFPTQVIVTQEVDPELHPALKVLSRKAKEDDVRNFIDMAHAFTDHEDKMNAEAVFKVSINANGQVYHNVIRGNSVMCAEMLDLVQDEVDKQKQDAVDMSLINVIRNLMKNNNWDAMTAMTSMELPLTDRIRYAAML